MIKKIMKKAVDNISMAKTRSNTCENGPELPGFNVYYHSSLIDTDFVAYFVPISASMPVACTFK